MIAYLDCEFHGFDDLRPISIGLVSGSNTFYAEFEIEENKCSSWIAENVLPKLDGSKEDSAVIAISLVSWLDSNGVSEVVCDTSYDERIFKSLVGDRFKVRQVRQDLSIVNAHHALQDAIALQNRQRAVIPRS